MNTVLNDVWGMVCSTSERNQRDIYNNTYNIICPECKGEGYTLTVDYLKTKDNTTKDVCRNCLGEKVIKVSIQVSRK